MNQYNDSSPRKQSQQLNQILSTTVMPSIREAILAGAREAAGKRYADPDVFDIDRIGEQIIRRVIGFLYLGEVAGEDTVLHPCQLDDAHVKAWFGVGGSHE